MTFAVKHTRLLTFDIVLAHRWAQRRISLARCRGANGRESHPRLKLCRTRAQPSFGVRLSSPSMHQIAYISHASLHVTLEDLTELCRSSSLHNESSGVSGLLVYDGKRFMQVIEGDSTSIRPLMDRIAADNRHKKIDYLADEPLAARQFGTWALACVGFRQNSTAAELLADVKTIVCDVPNVTLKAAFIGFALLAKRPSDVVSSGEWLNDLIAAGLLSTTLLRSGSDHPKADRSFRPSCRHSQRGPS
jgi:hypothetical protein